MAQRVATRWVLATLRPSVVGNDRFEITGREVPVFFHAGKAVVQNLKDRLFDGWYGYGFYAAFDAEYVRRWYGPVVTRLRAKPGARVLVGSIRADAAPPGLLEAVLANELKVALNGDRAKLEEFRGFVLENSVQWIHAVDRLAIEHGYDLVLFSDEQIVVKPTDSTYTNFAVTILGEEPRAGTA